MTELSPEEKEEQEVQPEETETIKTNQEEIEQKKENRQIEGFIRILLYIFSFFMGPFGLGVILGAIFYVQQDSEFREVGKVCLILSILPALLIISLLLLMVIFGLFVGIGSLMF